jgi:hypothetical protein
MKGMRDFRVNMSFPGMAPVNIEKIPGFAGSEACNGHWEFEIPFVCLDR